jgi:hypothetical protein
MRANITKMAHFFLLAYHRWVIHFSCCLFTLVAALDSHVLMQVALETFSNPTPNLTQSQECDDDDYMMSGSSVRISAPHKVNFFSVLPTSGMARQHWGIATSLSPTIPSATCEYDHCNGIGAPLRC